MVRRYFFFLIVGIFAFASLGKADGNVHVSSSQIIFVFDCDDTLFLSDILGTFGGKFNKVSRLLDSTDHFAGMSTLLQQAKANGHLVYYVSGAPWFFRKYTQAHLAEGRFPEGELFNRPSVRVSTVDFKKKTIAEIIERHPGQVIVLVGDNGELDPEIYEALTQNPKFSNRVIKTFIRMLYKDGVGKATRLGQVGFHSAADLAIEFLELGAVTRANFRDLLVELSQVLEQAHDELLKQRVHPTRVMDFVNKIRRAISMQKDQEVMDLLESVMMKVLRGCGRTLEV